VRLFLAVTVVLLILLLIFAVQNPGSTEVTFLTFSAAVSLLLIVGVSLAVGLLLGIAIMMPGMLRRSSRLHRTQSETGRLKAESVESSRALAEAQRESADLRGRDSQNNPPGQM
jgi:uncharacterized integral membrane protein